MGEYLRSIENRPELEPGGVENAVEGERSQGATSVVSTTKRGLRVFNLAAQINKGVKVSVAGGSGDGYPVDKSMIIPEDIYCVEIQSLSAAVDGKYWQTVARIQEGNHDLHIRPRK